MNFSAKLKASQQPNYIFNFNIDIPIKYKSSVTHRSNPISPAKSPGKLNQKRYKLSSITPRPTGVSESVTLAKKGEKSSVKSNKKNQNQKIPKTMKEQFLEKDLYQIQNFPSSNYDKKAQPSISRKTQKITTNKKSLNEQICPSRKTVKHPHIKNSSSQQSHQIQQIHTISYTKPNVVRNVSILQKLVTDDNNIKYPTDTSEFKRTDDAYYVKIDNFMAKLAMQEKLMENEKKVKNLVNSQRIETVCDEFDMTEIREFEEISTQRKQKLNYDYLKEKILVEASVRKIQRAWRNYRTKKLVNCYSSTLSARHLKSQLITSARSQTKGINISKQKKLFHSNDLFQSKKNKKDQMIRQNFCDAQNGELSSDESQDFGQRERAELIRQEQRPFSKKPNHSTGKSQNKFFQNQKVKKQLSPRVLLPRPASPKTTPTQRKGMTKHEKIQTPLFAEKQTQRYNERQRQIQEKLKKFQEEQIRKWEEILDSIKKGKKIEVLLQKSQKYKRQLETNLKHQINLSTINQNRASPILFKSRSSKSSLSDLSNLNITGNNKNRLTKQLQSQLQKRYSESPIQPHEMTPQSYQNTKNQLQYLGETAQRRKEKIMFFENQILKIDNEDYSDMSSVSCQSINKFYPKLNHNLNLQEKEREENLKLRKKLQLFNTHFLDISSAEEGLTDRSLKGLKGNSTDERRNNINKRFSQSIHNQQISQHFQNKEPSSSEQSRKNRRPDVTIITNQQSKPKPISKIHQLINRKIQYPAQSSSPESSLEIQNTENSPSNYGQSISKISDDSSGEDVSQFNAHVTNLINQELYGEPVMTHRDRRLNVPELNLDNLPKKFPPLNSLKEQISSEVVQNSQIQPRPVEQKQEKKHNHILEAVQKSLKNEKPFEKPNMQDTLKICSYIEEELIYEGLLQFSDSNKIVHSIKCLFDNFKKEKKKVKPEGICTNLESIKDYLQNFVENKLTEQVEKSLGTSCGPKATDLLKFLRRDSEYQNEQNEYIMSIDIFEKHWKYANSNIYFDRKYSDDKMEQERVAYLKGLTRVYFRSIFDAFNESLEFQRSYGLTGKPYPWSKKMTKQNSKTLKTACQLAYRRILKISVVYFGVHFDDKSHLFNQEEIKELQEERLLTLLMMELEEDQYRWQFIEDELAEIKYDIALNIEKIILEETLRQLAQIQGKRQEQQTLIN